MTLLALCLGWVAGIAIEPRFDSPLWMWLSAGAVLAAGLFFVRGRGRLAIAVVAALAFGAARMRATHPQPGPTFIGYFVDPQREVTLAATVLGDPRPRPAGVELQVSVDRLLAASGEVVRPQGLVLVKLLPQQAGEIEYGDSVIVRGALKAPKHDQPFDYAEYLAHQGVYAVLEWPQVLLLSKPEAPGVRARIYRLRHRAYQVLTRIMPLPEREIMAGILLGIESGIPEATREAYNRTGTTHIIAISGFNISIIAGALLSAVRRAPRRWPGWLLAILGIAFYAVLVGAAPSVVRAAIMGTLGLLARQIGRRTFALGTLGLSAALMTAIQPGALWDSGFQLSFAATMGLVLYADPMQTRVEAWLSARTGALRARRAALVLSDYVLLTLAAQLTTLPLILLNFGRLSFASLVVNPLILPAQPMVMILGGAAVLGGLASPWLGRVLGAVAWVPMAYTTRVVTMFAGLPWAAQPVAGFTPAAAALAYGLLFAVTFAIGRAKPRVPRPTPQGLARLATPALIGVALAVTLLWQWALVLPDGRLHLRLLDAEGGEAVLITTPSRRRLLINTGPNPDTLAVALAPELPLSGGTLDWVILASFDDDATGGLSEVAARHSILHVGVPAQAAGASPAVAAFLHECEQKLTPIDVLGEGSVMDLGDGGTLKVLAETSRGLLIELNYGQSRFLLPLGVDPDLLGYRASSGFVRQAQVLLLAEGGYASVNTPQWIDAVDPWLALLSTGMQTLNRPSAALLRSLEARTLLRTDVHGWIDIATDGRRLWVRTER